MNPTKQDPIADIIDLSHEGLGVAKIQGKTVFIEGGLPTEQVHFNYLMRKSKYDIGKATEIIRPAAIRTEPLCPHYDSCGGCSLQHVSADAQINIKQNLLLKQLKHFGLASPEFIFPPIHGKAYYYRRRARLNVKYNEKTKLMELGFSEKSSHRLSPIHQCEILDPKLSHLLPKLLELINSLTMKRFISQIEMAMGDSDIALVFRCSQDLSLNDQNTLKAFAKQMNLFLYLEINDSKTSLKNPKFNSKHSNNQKSHTNYTHHNDHARRMGDHDCNVEYIHKNNKVLDASQLCQLLYSPTGSNYLSYTLPDFDLQLAFHPLDFIQVNSGMNQAMVLKVLDLLELTENDRVLDLFCGLGNFTLPIARKAKQVCGIEGLQGLVERGYANAQLNRINNIEFHVSDLRKSFIGQHWAEMKYDKLVLDPPRAGALELMNFIPNFGVKSIVYISCDPATLARDVGELIKRNYRLKTVGIVDMFPQTKHVESIALLELK